jgi:hypothetical protein
LAANTPPKPPPITRTFFLSIAGQPFFGSHTYSNAALRQDDFDLSSRRKKPPQQFALLGVSRQTNSILDAVIGRCAWNCQRGLAADFLDTKSGLEP